MWLYLHIYIYKHLPVLCYQHLSFLFYLFHLCYHTVCMFLHAAALNNIINPVWFGTICLSRIIVNLVFEAEILEAGGLNEWMCALCALIGKCSVTPELTAQASKEAGPLGNLPVTNLDLQHYIGKIMKRLADCFCWALLYHQNTGFLSLSQCFSVQLWWACSQHYVRFWLLADRSNTHRSDSNSYRMMCSAVVDHLSQVLMCYV